MCEVVAEEEKEIITSFDSSYHGKNKDMVVGEVKGGEIVQSQTCRKRKITDREILPEENPLEFKNDDEAQTTGRRTSYRRDEKEFENDENSSASKGRGKKYFVKSKCSENNTDDIVQWPQQKNENKLLVDSICITSATASTNLQQQQGGIQNNKSANNKFVSFIFFIKY